jgi:hypothetical protein
MWHKYRELYKDRIVQGKKYRDKPARTVWESKWVRPEAYKMSTKKFLHLDYQQEDIDDLTADLGETPNASYLGGKTVWAVLKRDFAKVQHADRHKHLNHNIALINPEYTESLSDVVYNNNQIQRENARKKKKDRQPLNDPVQTYEIVKYMRCWKGKDPGEYDKVFMPVTWDDHWLLVVLNYLRKKIEVYDSIHRTYPVLIEGIQNFLEYMGCPLPEVEYMNEVTPVQREGYNCGMYTIMFCHRLFRDKLPQKKWHAKRDEEDQERVVKLIASKRMRRHEKFAEWFPTQKFDGFKVK